VRHLSTLLLTRRLERVRIHARKLGTLQVQPVAHDIFISYSSKDKIIADAVCARLEGRGIRCWIAPRDVNPGRPYGEEIILAIETCTAMVLVFSSNANVSTHIPKEIEHAVSHGIPVIPVRIEAVTPSKSLDYFISSVHWLDAITPPLEKHLENLANTVLKMLREHPRPASATSEGSNPSAAQPVLPPVAQVTRGRKIGLLAGMGAAVVALALGSWFFFGHTGDTTLGSPTVPTARVTKGQNETTPQPDRPEVGKQTSQRSNTHPAALPATRSAENTSHNAAEPGTATGQVRQARVDVSGRWAHQQIPQYFFTLKQDGDAVTSEGSLGHAEGHFTGPNTFFLSWQTIGTFQGTVEDDMISWSGGTSWKRQGK
jgi:hypothetical protein